MVGANGCFDQQKIKKIKIKKLLTENVIFSNSLVSSRLS